LILVTGLCKFFRHYFKFFIKNGTELDFLGKLFVEVESKSFLFLATIQMIFYTFVADNHFNEYYNEEDFYDTGGARSAVCYCPRSSSH
ncbi:MAG: hypothetical protein IJV05_00480, partial [Muribaculaceae bacterium]|nr:hypothetical protein [Muribaculaceae bacterium]